MTTVSKYILALTVLSLAACKQESKDTNEPEMVVAEAAEVPLAHNSDESFENALDAIKNKEYKVAGQHLIEATDELKAEANELDDDQMPNMQADLVLLDRYAKELEKGKPIDLLGLKELIASAELKVSHNYLLDEDVIVLSAPDKADDTRLHNHLNRTIANLEEGNKKIEGKVKKEGEELESESKKLEAEYQTWKKKVEEHLKKADAHFKKNQPEYTNYGIYPLM